jgi:thiol-disulfide isomerase/thioredoxin
MKKLFNLTRFLSVLLFSTAFLISCGTEEDVADQTIQVAVSSNSVIVGTPVTFSASSSLSGDISSQATYFVNDTQIEGNVFTPTEVNIANEVYAVYNGIQSAKVSFASIEEIPSEYTQKVLLEDYTGTWCGWCPRMATIVDYLGEHSENIIPVAIHTQGAPTDPWLYEHSLDMQVKYSAQGAPKGKFNRIYEVDMDIFNQSCPNNRTFYTNQADNYLNQNAKLGLALSSTLNGSNLNINVKVGFVVNALPEARLVVYLIEDGLTYNQVNYFSGLTTVNCDPEYNYASMPNPIPNFAQKHVLLKSYTDVYGDIIPQNAISNGATWSRDFNVSLPANVANANNLSIVAFVVGEGSTIQTRPVINAQSAKINTNQPFD